jgi:hypothetical protein
MNKFSVLTRNTQEKIGSYLLLLAQFFMITESIISIRGSRSEDTTIFSFYIIGGIVSIIVGWCMIYESKKRNGTLSDLNTFFRFIPYIAALGIIIGGIIFAIYYFR